MSTLVAVASLAGSANVETADAAVLDASGATVFSASAGAEVAADRSGTIGPSQPTLTWSGAPASATNAAYVAESGEPCGKTAADRCDVTLLHVAVDPSFWTEAGGVSVRVAPEGLANFDLFVYRSDASGARGELVASRAGFDDQPESASILKASGFYLVQVVYRETLAAGYRAEARFLPPSRWTPKHAVESLGLTCAPDGAVSEELEYQRCQERTDEEIRSFDGLGLTVRIGIPTNATGPLPTVLLLHGWAIGRGVWDPRSGVTRAAYNPASFAQRGYATIAFTARGFQASCGVFDPDPRGPTEDPEADPDPTCAKGYTHVADRAYEVRDAQHLLSVAVDHGLADPGSLAATGESMGGGQTWLLATSLPWHTPAGRSIQLAAAVPTQGYTDLLNFLAPNGRATDRADQSASHERPFGIWKEGVGDLAYAFGKIGPLALQNPPVMGRYNHLDRAELESYLDGWMAFFQAGEPYDSSDVGGITAAALASALRGKSAYYADDYLDAVRMRRAPAVPIFSVQGWTDGFFPAVEVLQMYRKLKAAARNYPIGMFFGDVGHPTAQNPASHHALWVRLANEFLDTYLLDGRTPETFVSLPTQCPAPATLPAAVSAPDWDRMTTGEATFEDGGTRQTSSTTPNPAEEAPTYLDPWGAARAVPRSCITQAPGSYGRESDWRWPVDGAAVTLLGLPTVKLDYALQGTDATVVAKLWDVAPDDTRTLVTRGAYRLTVPGDDDAGTIEFQLFGNHWRFEPGHSVELELSQTDAPFLRPNKLTSTIVFSSPKLVLPTVE